MMSTRKGPYRPADPTAPFQLVLTVGTFEASRPYWSRSGVRRAYARMRAYFDANGASGLMLTILTRKGA